MGKYEQVSVSLPTDLKDKVQDYADKTDMKRSQVVQQALEQFLEEEPREEDWEEDEEDLDLWENRVEKEISGLKSSMDKVLKKLSLKRNIREGKRSYLKVKQLEEEHKEEKEDDPWDWIDKEEEEEVRGQK